MPAITVKNIPDSLYVRLKEAAKADHRSINSEVIFCIEQVISGSETAVEDRIGKARVLREKTARRPITDKAFSRAKSAGRS